MINRKHVVAAVGLVLIALVMIFFAMKSTALREARRQSAVRAIAQLTCDAFAESSNYEMNSEQFKARLEQFRKDFGGDVYAEVFIAECEKRIDGFRKSK